MEAQFASMVTAAFGEVDGMKVARWLVGESILNAEDYALIASSEDAVLDMIIAPAKTAGAPTEAIKHKIAYKKLWAQCRAARDREGAPVAPEGGEAEHALCEKARKSCEAQWISNHGYALSPGRRLVATQLGPIHQLSHQLSPQPRDFFLIPIRKMRLQDGSVGAQSSDQEIGGVFIVYLKVRAFFLSCAFTNVDQQSFFNIGAAEAVNDKLLNFLFMKHAVGRPPPLRSMQRHGTRRPGCCSWG